LRSILDGVSTLASPTDTADLAARLRLGVTRLARKLRQQAEPGITPSMLSALTSVSRHGRMTMRELCAHEQVQPPSMTRVVAALVDAGLATRTPDPDDGRVAWVEITGTGSRLLERYHRRREAYLTKALARLEPREVAILEDAVGLLERLTEGTS
jgi:DNA-binding MarR family transcriptional regulator